MNKKLLCFGLGMILLFLLWTVLVCSVDKAPIGPNGSIVGFSGLNSIVHRITGVDMTFYAVTDWLGLIPLGFVVLFGVQGLAQWIKGKSLKKVDYSLRMLGVYYLVVLVLFVLFEELALNYRPVLIDGVLEASYPSSTTLLVLCVMPTVFIQLKLRVKNSILISCCNYCIAVFSVFMIVGRLLSGVHWATDIIGSVLLSAGLISIYCGIVFE